MDKRFPYHLCQPDKGKSCAACCGIYNFRRNGHKDTVERLRNNKKLLIQLAGHDLRAYSDMIRRSLNDSEKLYVTIFNCEFAGFLDEKERLVGCLLHPEQNNGRDLRDLGFYGAELCEGHYCLSYFYLTPQEQQLVINTTDDWYLYGLTITDIDLVKGVFSVISDMLGESLNPSIVAKNRDLKRIIKSLWEKKLSWPYRTKNENSFGKYIFRGEEYHQIEIPYNSFGVEVSPYHRIFLSFGSEFRNATELKAAEKILSEAFRSFVELYSKAKC